MADFMTTDYSNNTGGFDPIPTGNYEMIINKVQETATKNGAESLQVDLIVRNDLDKVPELAQTNAKYHNRHVFNDNWKRKATKQYDMDGLQYILDAVGVPEGTRIASMDDFFKLITHKPVKVYVQKEDNEYQGKTTEVNRVAPWNYSKSDFPEVQHVFKENDTAKNSTDPFASGDQSIDISESDLPF